MNFGRLIYRFRWPILGLWIALAAGLIVAVKPADPSINEPPSFLPADAPYQQALEALRKSFPESTGLSDAVIVIEKPAALSKEDLDAVEALAQTIEADLRQNADGAAPKKDSIRVLRPGSIPNVQVGGQPLHNPFISEDGRAALVIVSLPYNFITVHASRLVDRIRDAVAQHRIAGTRVALTGSASFGHDYAEAAKRSSDNTTIVTLIAVIVILLIVYRAPLAALAVLAAIGTAAMVTLRLLAALQCWGLHIGMAEQIFVIVLLFGAGTDYSLLLISRYREGLEALLPPAEALEQGLNGTLPALLASAGTNTAGLLMLTFARYSVFQTTGPAVGIALAVVLLAAITLTPALAAVLARALFWPRKDAREGADRPPAIVPGRPTTSNDDPPVNSRIWGRVAWIVTRRPVAVLMVTLSLMSIPAGRAMKQLWVYDTLASLAPNPGAPIGNASQGIEMVKSHWPVGEVAPVTVLVRVDKPIDLIAWQQECQKLTDAVRTMPGVGDVRSLAQPLGKDSPKHLNPIQNMLMMMGFAPEYLSSAQQPTSAASGPSSALYSATKLTAVLDQPALTLEAMDLTNRIGDRVRQQLAADHISAQVHLTGSTAEMIETRAITQSDFHRIALLTMGVIFLIVLVLVWEPLLALFMVITTVVSYLATLGICEWVLTGLMGFSGLDWKVEVFLFVVMVAVGQDYNIFLASRLAQEGQKLPTTRAVRRAIISTGPVISSCGIIMAATLGSLLAAELGLMQQLGFAFMLGMLIDTFIVRPLLVPAFVMITGRTGKSRGNRFKLQSSISNTP